jgi:hypothetical protein
LLDNGVFVPFFSITPGALGLGALIPPAAGGPLPPDTGCPEPALLLCKRLSDEVFFSNLLSIPGFNLENEVLRFA